MAEVTRRAAIRAVAAAGLIAAGASVALGDDKGAPGGAGTGGTDFAKAITKLCNDKEYRAKIEKDPKQLAKDYPSLSTGDLGLLSSVAEKCRGGTPAPGGGTEAPGFCCCCCC